MRKINISGRHHPAGVTTGWSTGGKLLRMTERGLIAVTVLVVACAGRVDDEPRTASADTGSPSPVSDAGGFVRPPSCPPAAPALGTACSADALLCDYDGCASRRVCRVGIWVDAPCGASIADGGVDDAAVTGTCPSSEPADRAACATRNLECLWSNGCGGVTRGVCAPIELEWALHKEGCRSGCPSDRPASGAKCATPSSAGEFCSYADGPCRNQCACSGAGTWSCFLVCGGGGGPWSACGPTGDWCPQRGVSCGCGRGGGECQCTATGWACTCG